MSDPLAELHEHYARGEERDRLSTPLGVVEFERTVEIVLRALPDPPAVVADVGGGPGRYALWLAELGYTVLHRDLVPLHVTQLAEEAATLGLSIDAAQGDARDLDLCERSVDAVLLLGPLYHLVARADRLRALSEACRVVKPGGPVFAAAISRWAPRLHGDVVAMMRHTYPNIREQLAVVERSGVIPALFPGSFSGFCHRPQQLRAELRAADLEVIDVVSVEGIAFALERLEERLAQSDDRAVVMEAARALERVPELLGISPHLLATARRRLDGGR